MTIFDFIPKHLRPVQSQDETQSSTAGSAGFTTDIAREVAAERERDRQEWEQVCHSAWLEMELEIHPSLTSQGQH